MFPKPLIECKNTSHISIWPLWISVFSEGEKNLVGQSKAFSLSIYNRYLLISSFGPISWCLFSLSNCVYFLFFFNHILAFWSIISVDVPLYFSIRLTQNVFTWSFMLVLSFIIILLSFNKYTFINISFFIMLVLSLIILINCFQPCFLNNKDMVLRTGRNAKISQV